MSNKFKQFILSSEILKSLSFYGIRLYLKYVKKHIIGENAKVGYSSKLIGNNIIGENCSFIGSKLGFASYISKDTHLQDVKIGNYCSIGPNVLSIHGTHPTKKYVSTHPAFFSTDFAYSYTKEQLFKEKPEPLESNEPYKTLIGNDVWVGASVNIIEGVKLGDGCIVAAGSLVNKDVEPYSIVGGVPAKHIRYRFEPNEIVFLLDFKWWQKSEEWIRTNSLLFSDIKEFINNTDK
ncbi:DapH/DapD/GlmU-related protein [uncultured Maribacter sp.]|uniref:CatB-related O-acetyltransferase n=1 Tax=uncultured Maribacter sp. TaxID=431308 RepID=UPI00261CC785|nr:DapH/DapD/GlmU-related protein [uncultured Maribacter sp.]